MPVGFGRYELLRRLGQGGMGEVFLAQRRAGGVAKRLVIKRIARARAGDPRFLAMFMREAQLSMALTHQNIVAVFDFGRTDGDVFLAMEHVEGIDLATARTRAPEPRVPPLIAAFIAAECCRALDHAHRRNGPDGAALRVVHRDVSPRNLLLSYAGEVKLADFGVAALAGEQPGRAQGTPTYMAPEQARGEMVDGRADIFALGLVLWEMLAGERVRTGSEVDALLAAAASGTLPAIDESIDPPLRAILARATAAQPDARYPDARAMLGDLDTYIVATRAARASAAPAELVAAWLERASPSRETAVELDGPAVAGVVTFSAHDGDGAGSGTLLSRAVTMDEEFAAEVAAGDSSAAGDAPPRSVSGEPLPVAVPRRRMLPVALAVTVGSVVAVWTVARLTSSPAAASLALPSAAPLVSPPPIAALVRAAPTSATPAGPPPPVGVPVPPARPTAVVIDHRRAAAVAHRPLLVPVAASAAPSPAVLHTVVVGAKPWATFRVDGGAEIHQTPESIQLSAGPHAIEFHNPTLGVERTVTISVPATGDIRYVEDLTH